jgi:heme/copper-type cytochrome/quinol oxidase subunit 2
MNYCIIMIIIIIIIIVIVNIIIWKRTFVEMAQMEEYNGKASDTNEAFEIIVK